MTQNADVMVGAQNKFKSLIWREVVSETQDRQRRRNNVIITGMEIPPTSTASEQFSSLFQFQRTANIKEMLPTCDN